MFVQRTKIPSLATTSYLGEEVKCTVFSSSVSLLWLESYTIHQGFNFDLRNRVYLEIDTFIDRSYNSLVKLLFHSLALKRDRKTNIIGPKLNDNYLISRAIL
jgi:hypothetical protein